MKVDVLQRQLNQASKLIQSQQHDRYSRSSHDQLGNDRQPVNSVERASPSDDEERHRLEDALAEAEKQLRAERERYETVERQLERSTSLLADKDVEMLQLRDRLADVERQLAEQINKNASVVDELDTCRADKIDLTQKLQLEKAKSSELEADVAHLRADMEDVMELRGLETTNRLLREDLERVEARLKAVQLDNSQLKETCVVSQETIHNLKLELETTAPALKQKDGNVKNLEETARTLRAEIGDLKISLTQAETLAAQTQTELIAVNCGLKDEQANVERLKERLNDETTKSQRLEKTVVDLYAELESKDLELETETKNSRIFRQQIETRLRMSEEENTKLQDLLRDAEKQVEELEEQLKAEEKQVVGTGSDPSRDETRREMTDGVAESEPNAGPIDDGCRPVATVLGVSVSTEAVAAGVAPPSDDDKLGERYVVAVRRMQSLQRDLRHAEARQAELEDNNALLRRQMTDTESSAEEVTAHLTAKVDQLTTQLDAAECHIQQLKV